jgi:hypothetical protein
MSDPNNVKISRITFASCVATIVLVSGCANYRNSGAAPGAVTGTAQSESKNNRANQGEFYNTETLTPGIGSALFPDPAWR